MQMGQIHLLVTVDMAVSQISSYFPAGTQLKFFTPYKRRTQCPFRIQHKTFAVYCCHKYCVL